MSLHGQIALVTGASRGIGAATAIELAARGAHVVLTARTQGGLEAVDDAITAAGGTATLLPLDLLDGEGIDRIGPSLFERFGRLDILVSNAATLGKLTPAPHILPKDWADVVGVNLAANWHLIRSCGPLLTIAPAGRAVFLTAKEASAPLSFWGAYGATKAGMEYLVRCWADETKTTNLRVNLFEPGIVRSKLRTQIMPGEEPQSVPGPESVAPQIADLCMPDVTVHGQLVAANSRLS